MEFLGDFLGFLPLTDELEEFQFPVTQRLDRENSELKKMLAESLLKNRVLEAVREKKLCARRTAGRWRNKR